MKRKKIDIGDFYYAKGGIVSKSSVISELQKLGFSKEKAQNLLEEHIDIYEINEDDEDSKTIALQIEEQYNQEYAKGGSIRQNLEKELHKLQRELNSPRLQTYKLGDTSEEEMARQRERLSKKARFDEILNILNEPETKYALGGEIIHKEYLRSNPNFESFKMDKGGEISDWANFVKENRGYFRIEKQTDGMMHLNTRATKPIHKIHDLQYAEQIIKIVKEKYPKTKASLYAPDNWVELELTFASGGRIIRSRYNSGLKEEFLEDMQELHNDIKEITLRDGSKISHDELMEAHRFDVGGKVRKGSLYVRQTSVDYFGDYEGTSKSKTRRWFRVNGPELTEEQLDRMAIRYIEKFGKENVRKKNFEWKGNGGAVEEMSDTVWQEYIKPMIKNLNDLFNSGKISFEDYNRAVNNLKKQ